MDFTVATIKEQLSVDEETAKKLHSLAAGYTDPEEYESVRTWIHHCHNFALHSELVMRAADEILQTHGVETLWRDESRMEVAYSYCNTGESYKPTVCYDHDNGEFLIAAWGDLQQQMDAEKEEERRLEKEEERRLEIVSATDREDIVEGMATVLWGHAWADHVEGTSCQNIGGRKIEDVMPEIPQLAYEHAERIAALIEETNTRAYAEHLGAQKPVTLPDLYARAVIAHESSGSGNEPASAERFGNCLAWQSMGAGVSWFDDHEEFDLVVPEDDQAAAALQDYALEHCAECRGGRGEEE